MKRSILLSLALVAACSTTLFAQSSDSAAEPAAVAEDATALSVDAARIDELRFRLTKKVVRGTVRSQKDETPLAGAGVVCGKDTLRTAADGSFLLTLPYEQQTVMLTVFPQEREKGRPEFGTETGEYPVDRLDIRLAASWGWPEMLWVALISICLVFAVLVLLVYIMKLFGLVFARKQQLPVATTKPVSQGQLHEEEIAAIAVALKLYKGALHDRESEVLTILSIKRAYSPWNSKIHGLTQMPDRK